jgi:exopolysaccharide production protein ExoY
VALVALAPVFAIIALLVKIDSPGPTLYRHRRIGQGGQPVDVLKFRSMRSECCRGERYGGAAAEAAFAKLMTDADRQAEFAATYKLRDDPRITRVGRFLRKTSLDELPQLVNALRGELSLVGPRPLVAGELEQYYGDAAPTLLATRPGITGYWQINGRSELEYADRVRLDLSYAENWSLSLDLKILAKTVRTLVGSRGAY